MSGTSTFQPPIGDLMIEIAERCGLDPVALTPQQYLSMRRSMNLTQSRWSNRGINLFKMSQVSTALVQGTAAYNVTANVMDIFDCFRRSTVGGNPVDTMLYALSRTDYAGVPNKTTQGPPTSFWFDKAPASGVMSIALWPTPDGNGPYTLLYWAFLRLQDATPESGGLLDVRWPAYEAWVAEVSAHFSQKFAPARTQVLAAIAKDAWQEFADADTERTSLHVSPDMSAYYD